jgi:fluoroacetyl-CoA thioesterase
MATERLTPGLTAEITTVVNDTLVVKHMGGEGVLSTLIGLMERAGMQMYGPAVNEGRHVA